MDVRQGFSGGVAVVPTYKIEHLIRICLQKLASIHHCLLEHIKLILYSHKNLSF